jgi:5-formyltetrahydrofolate cyclo-ligase
MLIARRQALPQAEREAAQQAIGFALSALIRDRAPDAGIIAVSMPHRGEVDLRGWMAVIDFQGIATLALPVVRAPQAPLGFARFRIGDALEKDAHGIGIPATRQWVTPDVIVVPCVGFSAARLRLGYGGGYYDRTLAALDPRPLSIGVAFECQRCEIDGQPHDVAMDAVVTERGVI